MLVVYLRDDDEVSPTIFDAGGVERALLSGDTRIVDGLREDLAHPLAGLNCAQLLDRVRPIGVREQRAGEDASARSDSVGEREGCRCLHARLG